MSRGSLFRVVSVCALALAPLLSGCRCSGDTTPAAGPASSSSAVAPAPAESREDADIKPVYPPLDGPVDPRAERLCSALHDLPAKRRGECCGQGAGISVGAECRRNLSGALRLDAVSLSDADVDRCVAALDEATKGCDWVASGGRLAPAPAECASAVKGKLTAGARCRSSLECPDGLRCHGVGPTTTGVCGPPRERTTCGATVDVLATYTRDDSYEARHPECAGVCSQRRCGPPLAAGADCVLNRECSAGLVCEGGKCAPGREGAAGEKCGGGRCVRGLRCVAGVCKPPLPEGGACSVDEECKSQCVKPPGASAGTCEKDCAMLRGPMPAFSARPRTLRPAMPRRAP